MNQTLRVLVLEDSAIDAELVIRELRHTGFVVTWERVETEPAYLAKLSSEPDLILADYSLPHFDGLKAVKRLRETGLEIPFILISGTMGEEAAVEAMKQGASDYLLKDRIGRLGSAVEHALEEKRLRAERRLALEQIHLQSTALKSAANAIIITDHSGIIQWVNPAFTELTGYTSAEAIGQNPRLLKSGRQQGEFYESFWKTILSGQTWRGEFINRRKDGSLFDDEHTVTPVRDAAGKITHFVAIMLDVSARKRAERELREASRFSQSTIDALTAHICVLDEVGAIIATNRAWRLFADANPGERPQLTIGVNYLQVCAAASGQGADDARNFAAGIAAVIGGTVAEFTFEYTCHSPEAKRWFVGRVTRFASDGPVRVVVAHENITERKQAEEKMQAHLAELARWQNVMTGRENRVMELKAEVNALLRCHGEPIRYSSVDNAAGKAPNSLA